MTSCKNPETVALPTYIKDFNCNKVIKSFALKRNEQSLRYTTNRKNRIQIEFIQYKWKL